MQYPPTELVLNAKGQVYHLGLSPDQISDKIILVGDQNRVELVGSFFEKKIHSSQHREFACITGEYKGKLVSVVSTGIGTDNIDITINELDALANIDLKLRNDNLEFRQLDLIRIGTCGLLQADIPLHTYILSTHAFGLDNIAHFYDISAKAEDIVLKNKINEHVQLPKEVVSYISRASEELIVNLDSDQVIKGVTITSSGFYGPQGRRLRLPIRASHLNDELTSFEFDHHKITNFEMESSALFALGGALGHRCATICLGIANRPNKQYSEDYKAHMGKLAEYVLDRI